MNKKSWIERSEALSKERTKVFLGPWPLQMLHAMVWPHWVISLSSKNLEDKQTKFYIILVTKRNEYQCMTSNPWISLIKQLFQYSKPSSYRCPKCSKIQLISNMAHQVSFISTWRPVPWPKIPLIYLLISAISTNIHPYRHLEEMVA